jgi:hypothetical protein
VELSICFLDACLPPYQNVRVRGRLIAIMIPLAILAFAEIGNDDQAQAATAMRHSVAESGQAGEQPAPKPDVPAILTAAVNTSATIQTMGIVGSSRQLRPAIGTFTVRPRPPLVAHSTDKPRIFPLLI